jgi:hypothetical protein
VVTRETDEETAAHEAATRETAEGAATHEGTARETGKGAAAHEGAPRETGEEAAAHRGAASLVKADAEDSGSASGALAGGVLTEDDVLHRLEEIEETA